jgi:membrane-bound ClpP family serine protease
MSELTVLIVLYLVGMFILLAEIFIPSHGILSIAGIGFLVAAIVKTFQYGGQNAGVIAILACMVILPALAFVSIKYWHRTPMGKLISPPNRPMTVDDIGVPVEELQQLIGQTGRTVSTLRPVGICEFNGKRVSCIAESGMVEVGVAVEGIGLSGADLTVMEKKI